MNYSEMPDDQLQSQLVGTEETLENLKTVIASGKSFPSIKKDLRDMKNPKYCTAPNRTFVALNKKRAANKKDTNK